MARITINDQPVYINKNEKNLDRGLHIVIVNPNNGRIIFTQVFDTYK